MTFAKVKYAIHTGLILKVDTSQQASLLRNLVLDI